MNILGIDPGSTRSGVVSFVEGRVEWACADMLNEAVLEEIAKSGPLRRIACETMQASYAATIGASVIDTLIWIGEFRHARRPLPLILLSRQQVKGAVCNGNTRATDAGVRQALIDRLGPPGTKRQPGPTHGVATHAWAALAVAVAAHDYLRAATGA